jgi:hypothetical protein
MSALVDLPLILNLSEPILAARRVRSLTELLAEDLPAMVVGTKLLGELRLCDSTGAILEESGNAAQTPVIRISHYTGGTQTVLATLSTFVAITADPKGWSFTLDLTAAAFTTYLGTAGEPKEAVFEINLSRTGALRPLYRRRVTLLPVAAAPA